MEIDKTELPTCVEELGYEFTMAGALEPLGEQGRGLCLKA